MDMTHVGLPFDPSNPPAIRFAESVAPSDVSTSVVVDVSAEAQISLGTAEVATHSDIAFAARSKSGGTTRELRLDLLQPATRGPHPLAVYVTGGGFRLVMKETALARRTYVAEAGFVVASIEYRTIADGAQWKDAVADVKEAVRFLRANARRYDIDPGRVALWGESAGGYLVAMTGLTNGVPDFETGEHLEQSSRVDAVIDLFGPSNLAEIRADFDEETRRTFDDDGAMARFVHGADTVKGIADDQAGLRESDPSTYASAEGPAFFFLHGSNDRLVSPSQTLLVHQALLAAGADSIRWVLRGADHGDPPFLGPEGNGRYWSTTTVVDAMVDFIRAKTGASRMRS